MKYIWLILITLIAGSAFSANRIDSLFGTTNTDDSWISSGLQSDWNNGTDTLLLFAASTKKTVFRINTAGWSTIPTAFIVDSIAVWLRVDSAVITVDRADSGYVCYRDWIEGTKARTDNTPFEACVTYNKYTANGSSADSLWGTAGCQNTTTDRSGTAFDWEPIQTTDVAGNWKTWWFRDTAIIRQMRTNVAGFRGGFVFWQASGTGQQHAFASTENANAADRPFMMVYSHSIDGTNQRLANGMLGMRINNGNVARRLRADYGY